MENERLIVKPRVSGSVDMPLHRPSPRAVLSRCPPPALKRECYLGCVGGGWGVRLFLFRAKLSRLCGDLIPQYPIPASSWEGATRAEGCSVPPVLFTPPPGDLHLMGWKMQVWSRNWRNAFNSNIRAWCSPKFMLLWVCTMHGHVRRGKY